MAANTAWENLQKRQWKEKQQQQEREHAKRLLIGLLYLLVGRESHDMKINKLLHRLNVDDEIISDLIKKTYCCKVTTIKALRRAGVETIMSNGKVIYL